MNSSLRVQREARGWSQADVAQRLHTPIESVKQWEGGSSVPAPSVRRAWSKLLGLDEHTLWPVSETIERRSYGGYAFLLLPPAPSRLPPALPAASSRELGQETEVSDPLLPLPFTAANRLIGRDRLLAQFKEHLLRRHALGLYGLAGGGKTALLRALAHDQEIRAQFSDGIVWAGLTPQSSSVNSVLRRWGTLWEITTVEQKNQPSQAAWQAALHNVLADRSVLFLLDDVWQVETIAALYVGGSGSACVLTTRFAHIARHLGDDCAFQVPELEDDDSLRLLTRFVPDILQDDYPTALNLVQAVGGHPLALTLMSKYLGGCARMGQPRRLQAALQLLQKTEQRTRLYVPHGPLDLPPASLLEGGVSVESVIAVSDQHLPTVAQRALRAIAVLPPSPMLLSQEAILAVADVPLEILAILCDAGLLEQRGSTQYRIQRVVADYARTQGIEQAAFMRLIRYGINFIERHLTDPVALERESPLLQAALDCAWMVGQCEEFVRGSLLYTPFLLQWGWDSVAEELLHRVYRIATQNGWLRDQMQVLEYLSLLAHRRGGEKPS